MKRYLEFIKENNSGEAEKVSAQINSIFDKFGWQIEFVPGDGEEVETGLNDKELEYIRKTFGHNERDDA